MTCPVISKLASMSRWEPDAYGRLERAALDLFAEHGFDQVTVPEITARAGLTTRTFLRHSADKREVLFADANRMPAVRSTAAGDPILTWVQRYPHHGDGWCLDYNDGEATFIGGDLTDVDWAVDQANKWLDQIPGSSG